ncbi:MAG: ABC transporter ATP-binding protein [Lachnospiraceae bacterium]|nr:ABC transporter ATP-binding protein [Lachnospiraceae bacterium]
MEQPLLKISNLDVEYNQSRVISNVSLSVNEGEILGIVGESGSGKSTLIKSAMGILSNNGCVSNGSIFYKERDLLNASAEELRRVRGTEMGMIFQNCESSLCPVRTIGDQVYETMVQHMKVTKKNAKEKALELLEILHFSDGKRVLKSYPFELSGGMNQRVGIMMAMLLKPSLLFADEPTSALDVTVQKQVVNEMLRIRDNFGTAIVIVTHNIGVVNYIADNIVVMYKGNVVEYGKKDDIINNPKNEYTIKLLKAVPKLKVEES